MRTADKLDVRLSFKAGALVKAYVNYVVADGDLSKAGTRTLAISSGLADQIMKLAEDTLRSGGDL